MNRNYVLFDEDIQAGCNVDYMSEECAAAENEQFEQEGASVRWIPYEEYLERSEKRAHSARELHSSLLSKLTGQSLK